VIKLSPSTDLTSSPEETAAGAFAGRFRTFHKRLGLALLVFAVGILAVIQSLNTMASKNREPVHQELQKLLGTDASFDRLEANLWGGLGFSAREFRIADNPRFAATPLLHATELKLGVSWWQLLLGRVVIDSLTFENPEFQIITDEEGLLNLATLGFGKKELSVIPKLQMASPDRRRPAVSFLVTKIRVKNGLVDFLDRSVKEPAEIQIRNIDMKFNGLDPAGKTSLSLTAALTEGLRRDVKIQGQLGPIWHGRAWSQQPVDLEMQFDSLYVPMLARAMPFLRNEIPPELDVTGPMSFHAKLAGSFAQPRLSDVTLKVPFFGSSDYNAILTGTMELPENRSWDEALIKGKLSVNSVNLTNLRNLPLLKEILPVHLMAEGSLSIFSQFEGSWEQLRIGALIKADKSELRYRDWLRKPAGNAARLRAQISRQQKKLVLHDSELSLGNSTMIVSGLVEETPESRLQLKLQSGPSKLADWGRLVSPLSVYGVGGRVNWDIVLEKKFTLANDRWDIRGKLRLANAELRHKPSGRKIDQLNAGILFLGRGARIQTASFRVGSSRISMSADVTDLLQPSATYRLWSEELNPRDLLPFPIGQPTRIKQVTATGEVKMQDGALSAGGSLSSPEGNLQQTLYRNLRADVRWSPTGISFKNLSLNTLNGNFRFDGAWAANGDGTHTLRLIPEIDSIDLQTLMSRMAPKLGNRIEGSLNFRGRFDAAIQSNQILPTDLKGSGETEISHGTFKDFNLMSQFFLRGHDSSAAGTIAALLPANLAALLDQRDTPFDTLRANFTIEQQRIRTNNLLLSTPDYTITAAGWVRFDGGTQWNGSLVLAPRLTQELQREYKTIRYLLDRRGKLSISFRVDGTLPNPRVRPENRALAQALRWRSPQKANVSSPSAEKDQNKGGTKGWLPESLDRLLHR
jgi:AsmA-like C-terminal region/AsmA family